MHAMSHHLDDEHMQLYEWSGAGTGMPHALPAGSKRSHPWHASYAVLALLTSLLILNGCDSKGPAEKAGEQVDQAMQEMKEEAGELVDDVTTEPGPAQEAGRSLDEARDQAGEKIEQLGEDLQKP
ncbi:MAG TPA: hypothetical protein DEB56_02710 [Thiobacillus sp.]|nr:hypothetical protein [Thiobacillus sp.]